MELEPGEKDLIWTLAFAESGKDAIEAIDRFIGLYPEEAATKYAAAAEIFRSDCTPEEKADRLRELSESSVAERAAAAAAAARRQRPRS